MALTRLTLNKSSFLKSLTAPHYFLSSQQLADQKGVTVGEGQLGCVIFLRFSIAHFILCIPMEDFKDGRRYL